MAADGWFATDMIRFARSRQELARSKCKSRRPAIAPPLRARRIRFTSNILPKWARRTKSLDALLPVLYLRGISAGDFQEALAALLGKDAPNLSAAVIARLKSEWEDECRRWQKRDLSARHYVYVWADGVYLQARMEPQASRAVDMPLRLDIPTAETEVARGGLILEGQGQARLHLKSNPPWSHQCGPVHQTKGLGFLLAAAM